ncbi:MULTISPECIES: HNH endonuclease signature motif containing protein [Arthrobacter]|uniref:HNH endonuclease signature motif containing protein n=1 Tax=Arthrobacter TaxID=1663 RepID=UPI001F209955|nr:MULTISPECIES: HNH endonuclease signature motif containing protein [Arthrobacter]
MSDDSDPLRVVADGCLDALAEVARLEARTAALKARLLTQYVNAATALAPPAGSPTEATAQELSVVAEVACVLTVSERTASGLIGDAHALTGLPLTAAALGAGRISWQHARIIIDQTGTLDCAGTAALEEHFLHPDTPALGCTAGELVPARFRSKVRTWRERHHRDSIEERHAKSARDRRVEYVPDADGMAWLSAYLPAGTAAGIWNRTTAAARACQGPDEPRTLAQLRADITATWLLTTNELPRLGGLPDGGPGVKGSSAPTTGVAVRGGAPSAGAHVRGGAPTTGVAVPGSARTTGLAVPGNPEAPDDDGVLRLPDRETGDADILRNGPRLPDTVPGLPVGADVIPDVVPLEAASSGGMPFGAVPVPQAQVLVTVPVLSLLGVTEEAAMLDGYGPIPPSMARELVAGGAGSFYRVLTDPRDGAPLEIGRTSYRLTKAMRQWLRLRDGKCPFPGCGNQSPDNEADHLLAWAKGGTTGISNLGQPCPKHHRLKHGTAWTPTGADKHRPPGWTSPTGRQYSSEHQDWEPPHLPGTITHRNPSPGRDGSSAISPDTDLPYQAVPGYDPNLPEDLLPEDPDLQQDRELPPDPLPDWRAFISAHPWPESDHHDLPEDEALPSYPAPIDDPIRDHAYIQTA